MSRTLGVWRLACLAAVPLASALAVPAASAAPAYARYPDILGERIVFCAEGDLWLTDTAGRAPRRLTVHPGTEYFPHFSPDGAWIAFTGEYDGNRDVYIIPAEGGEPRRLTWHPATDEVLGWTPDGARILFRSPREHPHGSWEIFSIPAAGGDPQKLPLGWAARLAIDPESGLWAFNRKSRETRTWKRYRGGLAPKIWVGDPRSADFHQITHVTANDMFPMWHGGRIYFLSDLGGTTNIWSVLPDGSDRRRHTDFGSWDARWPNMGSDGRIAFTLAADIHVFDPRDESVRKIEVDLPSDRRLTRLRYPQPSRWISWFDLAPDGERLAVVTRGEIYSVPVKEGVTLAITRGSGAREQWAAFDAQGQRILYVTDEAQEEEIRTADAWGRGETKTVVPAGKSGYIYPPRFSPDGKWIAYADQTQTLYTVAVEGGEPIVVDRSTQREIADYSWSPDGRWLAYAKAEPVTDYGSIFVYDTRERRTHRVTGASTNDFSPAWDPEGRYLYFLSERATNPVLGSRDWQNIELRSTLPYLVLLRPDVEHPFQPRAGLPEKEKEAEKQDGKKSKRDQAAKRQKAQAEEAKAEPVEIVFEGLADRAVEFPVPRGRYFALTATAERVFYIEAPVRGMAELPQLFGEAPPENDLIAFDLEKKEAQTFLEGIAGYTLSPEAGKMAVLKGPGEIYVVDASGPAEEAALAESRVALDGIVLELDPREEWRQIFHESWRMMRDFYWDPGMGGVDWAAIREQYARLLPRLATRDDLGDLLGEMIGELATSHTYVFGGDPGVEMDRASTGLLGADLVREGEAYRVVRIYRGDPADRERSPLEEPGAGVREGDYILAVNHTPLPKDRPFLAALENRAGKQVVLTVNSRPAREGARDVVVTPLESEAHLRYADWVRRNRDYVAQKTGGKVGYLHLPDMWSDGLIAFNTWFYPQLDKEGLIVDVRWNGGGAVSQMIVERLRRRVLGFDRARGGGVGTYPARVLNGPFVVLVNEFAGSDGDIFPMAIKLEKLAPIIGMRTWGGVIGIRLDRQLVDGGILTQPEFAWWSPPLGWELENRGVEPDLVVQNMPQELARGVDAQLDRAIEEVLRLREARPPVKPEFGPPRDRSREAYLDELRSREP